MIHTRPRAACLLLLLAATAAAQEAPARRAMTFGDVMRFRSIRTPVISDDGRVVACEVRPDRGDGEVWVRVVGTDRRVVVPRGTAPKLAAGGRHAVATVVPPFGATGKDKPKNALAIVDVRSGEVETIADVERAVFSDDGRYLAWRHFETEEEKKGKSKRTRGRTVVLRDLQGKADVRVTWVTEFAFSPDSRVLDFVRCTPDGKANGLFHRDLGSGAERGTARPGVVVGRFARAAQEARLAFTTAAQRDDGELGAATLHAGGREFGAGSFGQGFVLRNDTDLAWSKDGRRLVFSVRETRMEDLVAANDKKKKDEGAKKPGGAYDVEAILADREVDVWHARDPLINTHQKKEWSRVSKQSYRCVFDAASGTCRRLADLYVSDVALQDGSPRALGRGNRPYRREITWDGRFSDHYLVDVATGKYQKVLARHSGPVSLSPRGGFLVWYANGHWWLRDNATGKRRVLTTGMNVPFADEDHDYPSATPGYGIGGWLADESAVLIYDKYDVWCFAPGGGRVRCLTAGHGRAGRRQFRVVDLDPESDHLDKDAPVLLTGFDEETKDWSLWSCAPTTPGLRRLWSGDDKVSVLAKAKKADRILFTLEDYDRFPDLLVADPTFRRVDRVTDLDAQRAPFKWGTAELIDWRSADGRRLQGAVIKPGDYDPEKRYPVLVYYYRFFSQRVNEWDPVVVNHRPCFPFYASNGYVVFLPDIRFDIGRPGPAATKCLVPGVQKLIDLGIADPDAIALHGHSWSGYQTAFVITETNMFACAIAGAPVSNMTSAYGGIRWETGLSRQFQYEKAQSRIGGSLWEFPERYVENSPVFFADRIRTPLLIQFGDEDGAVPWTQGIELYMAMRRLDKPCVFLQYRKEPHHLQKYANKLDYSIRFKEYLDHYCRGAAAPRWITHGVPYAGR